MEENSRMFKPTERGKEIDERDAFKVILHFVRHGQKSGPNDVDWDTDVAMPITEKGREQAAALSSKSETDRPLAFGGERRRLRETALFAVSGENAPGGIDELKEMLDDSGERYGNRLWKIKGLDFALDKSLPEFQEINTAPHYFRKLVELDDRKRGDSVYARHAYGIAKIIEWAALAAPKLRNRYALHEERGSSTADDGPAREAFLGTQGGVSESFLAEIILRTKGKDERDTFINAVPNGVKETEGFDVELVTAGGEPQLRISYALGEGEHAYSYNEVIPLSIVTDIVEEFSPRKT